MLKGGNSHGFAESVPVSHVMSRSDPEYHIRVTMRKWKMGIDQIGFYCNGGSEFRRGYLSGWGYRSGER